MALTDATCSTAKATGKEYEKPDKDALCLVVRKKGTRLWRYQFRINRIKDKISYGNYPEISLDNARKLHYVARQLVELGRNPKEVLNNSIAKQLVLEGHSLKEIEAHIAQINKETALKNRMTFGEAASRYKSEYVDRKWKNPNKGWSPVRVHLLPNFENFALDDLSDTVLRETLITVRELRGEQAALHAYGWARVIYDYALEAKWCTTNPARQIKPSRIGTRKKRDRFLTLPEVKRYLIAIYQSSSYLGYKLALHLLLMLGLRKNEICGANWSEFDLNTGQWTIPGIRMKGKKTHTVMLPKQAIAMFEELKRLGCGSEWVLPMRTNAGRPMGGDRVDTTHEAALLAANILDYHIHDHRHTISTQLREKGHYHEIVELILSHPVPGLAGNYAHVEYLSQRKIILQDWADLLDEIMKENTVIYATFKTDI